MLEAGDDFVSIKETVGEDGEPNLRLQMDRKKLLTVGHPAIKKFLEKLQVPCAPYLVRQSIFLLLLDISLDLVFIRKI